MSAVNIAEFLGGLGLFLLGSRWAASGLSEIVERLESGAGWRSRDPVRVFVRGTWLAASQFGSGELPSVAVHLGTRPAASTERVALLASGASLGTLAAGLLALATSLGWLVPALALCVLLATVVLPLRRGLRTWDSRREMIAGWALSIVGLATLKSGLYGMAPSPAREFVADGPMNVLLLIAGGAALAFVLRSAPAVAAVAILAAGANLIDAWSGALLLTGAVLAIPVATLREAWRGSCDERCAAGGHALFCALWFVSGLALLFCVASARGLLEGFPGVSVLLLHTLTGILAALVAWPLLGPLERLVRARLESDPGTAFRIDWHGDPELLSPDLRRILDEAATQARTLSWSVFGGGAVNAQRWEAALSDLETAVAALREFQSAQSLLRVRLSLGCSVQVAVRSAEAWRDFGQWLAQFQPAPPVAEPALERRMVQNRLLLAKVIESSRVEAEAFSLEAWRCRMDGVERATLELRTQAISAWAAGVLPPLQLTSIESEIEWLRDLLRVADRAVSEWNSLVCGDEVSAGPSAFESSVVPSPAEAA